MYAVMCCCFEPFRIGWASWRMVRCNRPLVKTQNTKLLSYSIRAALKFTGTSFEFGLWNDFWSPFRLDPGTFRSTAEIVNVYDSNIGISDAQIVQWSVSILLSERYPGRTWPWIKNLPDMIGSCIKSYGSHVQLIDWCCFCYFVRNNLVALLEAWCARFVNIHT